MSATLWISDDDTVELGGTLQLYQRFAEMAKLEGKNYLKTYSTLFSVCNAVEHQEPVPTDWLEELRFEADLFLEEHGAELSEGAKGLLNLLRGTHARP